MAKYGLEWEPSSREDMLRTFTYIVRETPECKLTSVDKRNERMFYCDENPVYVVVQDHGLERVYKVVRK